MAASYAKRRRAAQRLLAELERPGAPEELAGEDVARELKVARRTVYGWAKAGLIERERDRVTTESLRRHLARWLAEGPNYATAGAMLQRLSGWGAPGA